MKILAFIASMLGYMFLWHYGWQLVVGVTLVLFADFILFVYQE